MCIFFYPDRRSLRGSKGQIRFSMGRKNLTISNGKNNSVNVFSNSLPCSTAMQSIGGETETTATYRNATAVDYERSLTHTHQKQTSKHKKFVLVWWVVIISNLVKKWYIDIQVTLKTTSHLYFDTSFSSTDIIIIAHVLHRFMKNNLKSRNEKYQGGDYLRANCHARRNWITFTKVTGHSGVINRVE